MNLDIKFLIFTLCQINHFEARDYGYYLRGSGINVLQKVGPEWCSRECARLTNCKSFNFRKETLDCLLNKLSKNESDPDKFVIDDAWFYDDNLEYGAGDHCSTVTCPENHKCVMLSDGQTTCIRTECGDPPLLAHASTFLRNPRRFVTKSVEYKCDEPKQPVNGTLVSKCKANGEWSEPDGQCAEQ